MPLPERGEVLIRVTAAGVNRPDVLQRSGLYPPPPGASPVLGLEVSGTIKTRNIAPIISQRPRRRSRGRWRKGSGR